MVGFCLECLYSLEVFWDMVDRFCFFYGINFEYNYLNNINNRLYNILLLRNFLDSKEYLNGLFCYKRECIYKINIRYG